MQKTPRIGLLIPWRKAGGIMIYSLKLAEKLKKYFTINVIKSPTPRTLNPFYFTNLAKQSRKNDLLHIQHSYSFFGSLFGIFHGIYAPLFYSSVKRNSGPKIITTMHDLVEPRKLNFLKKTYLAFMNFPIKKYSDRIIAHDIMLKDQLVRQGFDSKQIKVIPLGTEGPKKLMNSKEARKKSGIPERKTIVLYGWIRKDKQYNLVLDALSKLNDVQVLILGNVQDKGHFKKINEKINDLNLNNRVIFRHGIPDEHVFDFLQCADVVVLPYARISSSAVLNDSLAANLPAITSDLPEFRKIKQDFNCVKITNVYDKNTLAKTISEVLKNSAELRKNAKNFVKHNSRDFVASETKKLYDEVLNE